MPKNIVVCFDGTWAKPRKNDDESSNVWNLYCAILGRNMTEWPSGTAPGTPVVETIKWYDQGVGTAWNERIRGGTFGFGLSRNIREGFKFLIDNYEDGDDIYLFGFSRGAYTARSLVGLIRNIGLIKKEHAPQTDPDDNPSIAEGYELYRERDEGPDTSAAIQFRSKYSWDNVTIKFLGVWDTVGSLGVPLKSLKELNEERYAFHDTKLSGIIENAYQALAIDEHREDYVPTLWYSPSKPNQNMQQVWFAGAHSDVGGGPGKVLLSDIALRWMQKKASLDGSGLEIDPQQIPADSEGYITIGVSDPYKDGFFGLYRIWMFLTGGVRYFRPVKQLEHGNESIDQTALTKMSRDPKYEPKNEGLKG